MPNKAWIRGSAWARRIDGGLGHLPHGPNAATPMPVAPVPVPSASRVLPFADASAGREAYFVVPPPVTPKSAAAVPPAAPAAASVPPSPLPAATFTLDDVLIAWPKFMRWIEEKSPSLSFVLRVVKTGPGGGRAGVCSVPVPPSIAKKSGGRPQDQASCGGRPGRNDEGEGPGRWGGGGRAESKNHGMVDAVLKAFGGEVVEDLPAPPLRRLDSRGRTGYDPVRQAIRGSSNGRTTDSESVLSEVRIPSPQPNRKPPRRRFLFCPELSGRRVFVRTKTPLPGVLFLRAPIYFFMSPAMSKERVK